MEHNNMKKNENRSLFLYTALIFIVALLLIILSFFGESHMKNGQPKPAEPTATQTASGNSVTERAAQLSEDNRLLLEQNRLLTEENEKIRTENQALLEQADTATKTNTISEKLFDIYNLLYQRDYKGARAALAEIDPTTLDPTQTEFYDILVEKAN